MGRGVLKIDEGRANMGGRAVEGWVVYAKVRRREKTDQGNKLKCRLKRTCCTRLKNKEESRNRNYKQT
jgi:hypothetical protein